MWYKNDRSITNQTVKANNNVESGDVYYHVVSIVHYWKYILDRDLINRKKFDFMLVHQVSV